MPVFSIIFLRAFCSELRPSFSSFPFFPSFAPPCSASHALTTSPNNPPVKSLPSFHAIGTGSDTKPDHPSLARRYQNFFSNRLSVKYSFSLNSNVILTLLGSPSCTSPCPFPSPFSPSQAVEVEASKCSTEREVREESSRAESEGWMYWSISGGACSRTRGQKLGIWESVFWRRV